MNLKNILKQLKLNESTISTILGALVIIVVGMLLVNYFKGLDEGTTLPAIETQTSETNNSEYVVQEGDDLWSIAENQLGSGFEWQKLAEENNIEDPNTIEVGQVLTLPSVTKVEEEMTEESSATETEDEAMEADVVMEEPTQEIRVEETMEDPEEAMVEGSKGDDSSETANAISGDTYTVVHGDTLWTIATRAYGDGYKWVDIARANKLVNPDIIHAGNVFELPR